MSPWEPQVPVSPTPHYQRGPLPISRLTVCPQQCEVPAAFLPKQALSSVARMICQSSWAHNRMSGERSCMQQEALAVLSVSGASDRQVSCIQC